jgi:hypothetical protein
VTRTCKILLIPIVLVQFSIFLLMSRYRFIDGDEGFYLLASRLVCEHRVPYRDFVYLQTPLLPYVYGLWMKAVGVSWISARMLSGVLATLLGTLLYADVSTHTRRWPAGLCAGVLFASSTPIFAWLPVVKTYVFSALLLFLSYFILTRLSAASPQWACALSGLFLGIDVDARSYLAALIPVFLWWIYRELGIANRRAALLCFLGAFAIAILPNMYFLAVAPRAYFFDNLGYHAVRSNAGLIGDYRQKLVTLARVAVMGSPEGNGVQTAILLDVSLTSFFILRTARSATRLAFQLTAALVFISLLPTPTYVQYFCVAVPLLITATVCSASDLLDFLEVGQAKKLATRLLIACLALFVSLSAFDVRRYVVTGDGVSGLAGPQDAINWRISTVNRVSRAIDEIISPGEPVMSFWPGYIFESKASPLSGFENNFGLPVSRALNLRQLSEYHIVSHEQVSAKLRAREPRVVVLGNQDYNDEPMAPYAKTLPANGYSLVRSIGGTSIYLRRERPGWP